MPSSYYHVGGFSYFLELLPSCAFSHPHQCDGLCLNVIETYLHQDGYRHAAWTSEGHISESLDKNSSWLVLPLLGF